MGAVVVLTILATLVCGGGVYTAFSGKLGDGLSLRSCCCAAQWLARARSLVSGISRLADERRKRWTCRRSLTSITS